jgi:DNA-binding Xre family transcriptional regulator
MIALDLARLLESKEIQNPLRYLKKEAGFSYHIGRKLLYGRMARLNYSYLEQLCLLLNCTPNELLYWKPAPGTKATDKIALSKLAGRQRKDNLVRKINQLPEEKIDQLREWVNKLSEE